MSAFKFLSKSGALYLLFFISFFILIRATKGLFFLDIYAFLTRPLWPGNAQSELVKRSTQLETKIRLNLLEKDNNRLRKMLALQGASKINKVSAPVISRRTKGWWQQLELGKGSLNGIESGDAVTGPGGLLGRIESVTPTTSRVMLVTAPGSQVGVWIPRISKHGILLGNGRNRPDMDLLDKDSKVEVGDIVTTSPASILMPPNIPVGVIKTVDIDFKPSPRAIVQLTSSPEAIDWVLVEKL
tara:strand:- start:1623 stop:2348 length:726 start_codon:yes stop_codon:yes gene_type:complete